MGKIKYSIKKSILKSPKDKIVFSKEAKKILLGQKTILESMQKINKDFLQRHFTK